MYFKPDLKALRTCHKIKDLVAFIANVTNRAWAFLRFKKIVTVKNYQNVFFKENVAMKVCHQTHAYEKVTFDNYQTTNNLT